MPGETITLRASKIKNKAGYSTTLRPVAQPVLLPKLARAPGPGLLSGPQEVDVCSSMVLQLDIPSAWPLEYSWSSTDKKLNDFLKCHQASSVIKLPSVFPQFALETNIAYEISVFATEFLGQRSSILTHTVTKKAFPAPQIIISAYPTYYSYVDIILRGSAEFSSCGRDEPLVFNWTQVTSFSDIPRASLPVVPASALAAMGNSMLIPKSSLPSNAVFWIKLQASMLSNVTMFSSHVVQIRVLPPPLVAIADGGDGILISHTSALKLNSSRSLGLGAQDAVTFSWKCYTEQESTPEILIGECRDRQYNNLIALAKSPVLNILGGTSAPSSILNYNVELTLSQIGRAPAKKHNGCSSVKQLVSYRNNLLPCALRHIWNCKNE